VLRREFARCASSEQAARLLAGGTITGEVRCSWCRVVCFAFSLALSRWPFPFCCCFPFFLATMDGVWSRRRVAACRISLAALQGRVVCHLQAVREIPEVRTWPVGSLRSQSCSSPLPARLRFRRGGGGPPAGGCPARCDGHRVGSGRREHRSAVRRDQGHIWR